MTNEYLNLYIAANRNKGKLFWAFNIKRDVNRKSDKVLRLPLVKEIFNSWSPVDIFHIQTEMLEFT